MNPLQQIPTQVRVWLYFVGWIVGTLAAGTTVVWAAAAAASDVKMPVWLVVVSAALGFLQTQINLISGANVTPPAGVVEVHAPATVALQVDPQAAVQD